MLVNKPEKIFKVLGFVDTLTVVTIVDGKSDKFADQLPAIKKNFKSAQNIRTYIGAATGSKLFGLVLEGYASKGPWAYECVCAPPRFRTGFGKGLVKHIPPQPINAVSVNKFFNPTPAVRRTDQQLQQHDQCVTPSEPGADSVFWFRTTCVSHD